MVCELADVGDLVEISEESRAHRNGVFDAIVMIKLMALGYFMKRIQIKVGKGGIFNL